jgi:hypothetical protein
MHSDDASSSHRRPAGAAQQLLRRVVAKVGLLVAAVAAVLTGVPAKAHAAMSSVMAAADKVKGWDMFGRVPHDEWLFSNWRLTDPDLLKRSIVESVVSELPDVLGNFKRRKRLNELVIIGQGLGYFAVAAALAALLYKGGMEAHLRRMAREDRERGYSRPISAVSKKGGRKGKEIDGMEGWIDMEASDNDGDGKGGDDDEEDDD